MVSGSVAEVREAVQAAVAAVDPALLELAEAERLLREFSTMKRAAAAAVTVLAARVTECGAATRDGSPSDADWLAKKTGESTGTARRTLLTASKLKQAANTEQAFRKGSLSAEQAEAVAAATASSPQDEQRLLGLAAALPLKKLQDECARVRARAEDAAARHERIHRDRYFRTWTDCDGARCGQYRTTPDQAARIETALAPFTRAVFEQARVEGRREPSEAYAADGLVAMADAARDGSGGSRASTSTTILVNLESLRRGSVADGETCEIPGVGSIPVATALDLLGPDGLKVAVVDGVDVMTVVHYGRQPTAAQRTAIYIRDRGRCARPTCTRPMSEIDHTKDWSTTQETLLEDLAGLCDHDHDLKTHRGHSYRRGPTGWEWTRPDGTIETERRPPDP